jgi:hypothetical protein
MEWWVKEYGPIDKRHMVFGNINLAKFRFFSPIFQRSIVPTFQHVCRRFVLQPLWGEIKAWSCGPGFFTVHSHLDSLGQEKRLRRRVPEEV